MVPKQEAQAALGRVATGTSQTSQDPNCSQDCGSQFGGIKVLTARRGRRASDYVSPPPSNSNQPRRSIASAWAAIKAKSKLPDTLRLRDLHHTDASHTVLAGKRLHLTGKLFDHRATQSTERYAHLDRTAPETAASEIDTAILAIMDG